MSYDIVESVAKLTTALTACGTWPQGSVRSSRCLCPLFPMSPFLQHSDHTLLPAAVVVVVVDRFSGFNWRRTAVFQEGQNGCFNSRRTAVFQEGQNGCFNSRRTAVFQEGQNG